MKQRSTLFSLLYYLLLPILYTACIYLVVFISRLIDDGFTLGTAILATYALIFVCLPLAIVILMRFSLLKWYVDPFAAAMAPLFLYGLVLLGNIKDYPIFSEAFVKTNHWLLSDKGCIPIIGMFIVGLIASISPARKNGANISYRLLHKILQK